MHICVHQSSRNGPSALNSALTLVRCELGVPRLDFYMGFIPSPSHDLVINSLTNPFVK
ncbi:unnamed protein product [Rhodiola kirilowii]